MTLNEFNRRLKPWMLPLSMIIGIVFHNYIGYLSFLSPWLIFVMLLITYCKVSFSHFRTDRSMWWLLAVQIFGAIMAYIVLRGIGFMAHGGNWSVIAESVFICIFCPTATAAPVITGMLGGKIERVATYSILSNLCVAFSAPILLTYVDSNNTLGIGESMLTISYRVLPLILGPLLVSIIMQLTVPKVRKSIAEHQGLSFYIWAVALIIVVGNSVSFIMKEPPTMIPTMSIIALLSLAACMMQFYIGRKIGMRYGDPISSGQSLGQKNTVLAIWLALTYLNPIASIGPACYVAWHNIVNSWQIYRMFHN